MKRILMSLSAVVCVLVLCFPAFSIARVIGQEVAYKDGDVELKGYLAFDSNNQGKRPAVLVVHEWWGHNNYVRKRAEMLAELGYVALAVDMYGEGKQADHPEDAGKFASALTKNFDVMESRFLAGMNFLKIQDMVDTSKIAAIGYCFGGGVVLNMARQGVDLKGVASFHGTLGAARPGKKGAFKGKIIVFNGEADKFTTAEQIDSFKKEMNDLGIDYRFVNYPGAMHSFTNPEADIYARKFKMPVGYNEEADKKSWAELKVFLSDVFK